MTSARIRLAAATLVAALASTPAMRAQASCGDNFCAPVLEDCGTCPGDCPCWPGTTCSHNQCLDNGCGDDTCSASEDCSTCPDDCGCEEGSSCQAGACRPGPVTCSNGIPDPGEDCFNCPSDVAFKPTAAVSLPYPTSGQQVLFSSDPERLLLPQEPPALWDLGNAAHLPGEPIDLVYAYPADGTYSARVTAIERNCFAVRTSDPIQVVVGSGGGGGGCLTPFGRTPDPGCGGPRHTDALSVPGGATLIDVSWRDAVGESGYRVFRRDRPDDPWQVVADLPADRTAWRDSAERMPGPGQRDTYEYRVYPTGQGAQSPPLVDASLYAELPSAPRPIGPKQCIATTLPTYGWGTGLRAEHWQLEVRNADSGDVLYSRVLAETRHTPDLPLTAGVAYTFRVRAFNNVPEDDGAGPWSEPMYFMADCGELSPPFPLEPAGCADSLRPTLAWSAVPDAGGYKVKVKRAADDALLWYEDVLAPSTSFTIPANLSAGTDYWFQVKASHGPLDGPWSKMRYFTPQCSSGAPPGVAALISPWYAALSSPTPTFVWEPARQADHHRVVVRTFPQGALVLDATLDVGSTCSGLDCRLTPDLALPAGDYFWEVGATNAWGTGLPSAQARFTVPQFPVLTIEDATVVEGDAGFARVALRIRLSAAAVAPVSLRGTTVAGTATAGADFALRDEPLTVPVGADSATIEVDVAGDVLYEGDESFTVELSELAGAVFGDSSAVVTIVDQDPSPRLAIRDGRVVEADPPADSKLVLELTVSGARERSIEVDVALAGCTATPGLDLLPPAATTVAIPAGTDSTTIELQALADDLFEGDEIAFVRLSNPRGAAVADGEALAIVVNDDAPAPGGAAPLPPAADFDGDGGPDWLHRHDVSGSLVAWTMDGVVRRSGAFLDPSAPANLGWRPAALGDFDGDGDADLVLRNTTSGRLAFWYLDGLLRVGAALVDGPVDTAWRLAGAGDLDGDGRADLLWQHPLSGQLLAWLLDAAAGHREVAPAPSSTGDAALEVISVADFDGDAGADFVLRHASSGELSIWRIVDLARAEALPVSPAALADPQWRLAVAADVDRSGSLDLVWQHATTKRIAAWLMHGAARVCGTFAVPDAPADGAFSLVGPR
jgi:hypothetical protein